MITYLIKIWENLYMMHHIHTIELSIPKLLKMYSIFDFFNFEAVLGWNSYQNKITGPDSEEECCSTHFPIFNKTKSLPFEFEAS